MGDDDDQFRHYLPLVRRIIILVAVLTAVPVILWTITAFVRTYVGPPKVPTFRPMAAAATMDATGSASPAVKPEATAPQAAAPIAPAPIVEARATATDARSPQSAPKGPFLGDRSATEGDAGVAAASSTGAAVAMTRSAPSNPVPPAAQMPAAAGATDGTPSNAGPMPMQQPADVAEPQTEADTLRAGEPLAGPIPLPRHRPRYFAMVQVPMPRVRPGAAGPSASDVPPGPLDWLQKLFKPPQQQ